MWVRLIDILWRMFKGCHGVCVVYMWHFLCILLSDLLHRYLNIICLDHVASNTCRHTDRSAAWPCQLSGSWTRFR